MCNHIICDICKRKLCSRLISQLEICRNDFAHVCLLPPPPRLGMAAHSRSPASQMRPWTRQVSFHMAEDS